MKALIGLVLGVAGGAACAQSAATMYGSVDMALSVLNSGSGTTLPGGLGAPAAAQRLRRMDSGVGPAGRLGFRGVEDLGDGLSATFALEMGVGADTGALQQGGLAFGRQSYVGLSSKSGWSVRLGRQYSPMDDAIGNSEALLGAYWGNVTNGSGHGIYASIGSGAATGTFQATGRVNNAGLVSYTEGPWTGKLMLSAGDETQSKAGRLINPAIAYLSGPVAVHASVARIRQVDASISAGVNPAWLTEWVLGGSYDFGWMRLFGGAYRFNGPKDPAVLSPVATLGNAAASPFAYSWTKTQTAWLGARIPVGLATLIPQVAAMRYSYPAGLVGRSTTVAFAGEYPLSKRTVLYASVARITNNAQSRTPLIGTVASVPLTGFGADPRVVSLGLRHTF